MLAQRPVPWIGLTVGILIVFILIIFFVVLFLYTIFLKISLSLVSSKNNDFGAVFITALLCALVGWIPCLGCILQWVIINSRHETGFGMAIVVWILAIVIGWIIGFFIAWAIIATIYGVSLF
ncbi:MAG: hypothetical protein GF383_15230 [Candidatus Lokiarchaeota archaeon]|nr:hypothetical protein [Candidatus Lokiarchaeota archaeon]MBD3342876.1 hypothetical protein [Candidatus Lokiarchaeota archaeon]